jgi:hypothetical protein
MREREEDLVTAKRHYDPQLRFRNALWDSLLRLIRPSAFATLRRNNLPSAFRAG